MLCYYVFNSCKNWQRIDNFSMILQGSCRRRFHLCGRRILAKFMETTTSNFTKSNILYKVWQAREHIVDALFFHFLCQCIDVAISILDKLGKKDRSQRSKGIQDLKDTEDLKVDHCYFYQIKRMSRLSTDPRGLR